MTIDKFIFRKWYTDLVLGSAATRPLWGAIDRKASGSAGVIFTSPTTLWTGLALRRPSDGRARPTERQIKPSWGVGLWCASVGRVWRPVLTGIGVWRPALTEQCNTVRIVKNRLYS